MILYDNYISFIYVWNHIQGSMRYFPRVLHGSTNMSKLATNPFSLGKTSNSPVVARVSAVLLESEAYAAHTIPTISLRTSQSFYALIKPKKKKERGLSR